jgi:chorismate mutase
LTKWDHGAAVEDAPHEEKVIAGAVKEGQSKGLDPGSVSNFFKAQIEANKTVQYSLLAQWHRAGRAPDHAPIDLITVIRPQLDQIQEKLIAGLVETVAVRSTSSCQVEVAKAVGHYLSAHQNHTDSVFAVALDRALAAACVS